jgi:ParB family chromosome partitioning protein
MTTVATEYQTVPLARLVESAANPRRITSKAADAELADSVKKMGILEPLLVRSVVIPSRGDLPERLELIAGHRRLAAARAAGLTEVPVRVLELDDEQALEAAIVENLQRQDVHPLDEAEGFARLIEHHKHAVPDVAARVGKSEAYVYQRLALRRLSPKARKLFVDGLITAAHALQLVKLEPKQQDEVIKNCRLDSPHADERLTARRLAEEIREKFFQDLSSAPWKLADATLLPAAGACSTCPKRAGAQPGLFVDEKVKGETCLDAVCFDAKMKAHLAIVKTALKVDAGRKSVLEVSTGYEYPRQKGILYDGQFTRVDKKKPCAFATPAVVVGGNERGQALSVCVDAGCKEHHSRSSYGGDESWKKKQAAEGKKRKAENVARVATAAAILEKIDGHAPVPLKVRHVVALALFRNYPFSDQSKVLVQYGVEIPKGVYELSKHALRALAGKDAAALDFFLLRVVLAAEYFNRGADVVTELAAALGVKPVKPAAAAKAKKKPVPKPKATAKPK